MVWLSFSICLLLCLSLGMCRHWLESWSLLNWLKIALKFVGSCTAAFSQCLQLYYHHFSAMNRRTLYLPKLTLDCRCCAKFKEAWVSANVRYGNTILPRKDYFRLPRAQIFYQQQEHTMPELRSRDGDGVIQELGRLSMTFNELGILRSCLTF